MTGAAAIVGLVEAHRFTVDQIAPGKPSITSPAQGELVGSAPWFAFDAEPSATFECAWDGSGTFTACVAGRTRSFDNNGDHTLRIRAIDRAGNRSVPSDTLAFSARGRIERIDITSGPSGATRNASPVFRFSTKAVNVEFACRLNSHAFTACTSGKAYQGLADGTYTFDVQGMDEVGNVAIASRQFRVDTSTPVVDAPALADGIVTGRDISFGVGLSEPAALRCTLDGGGRALRSHGRAHRPHRRRPHDRDHGHGRGRQRGHAHAPVHRGHPGRSVRAGGADAARAGRRRPGAGGDAPQPRPSRR